MCAASTQRFCVFACCDTMATPRTDVALTSRSVEFCGVTGGSGGLPSWCDRHGRNAWDLMAVVLAVRGKGKYYKLMPGSMTFDARSGKNQWQDNHDFPPRSVRARPHRAARYSTRLRYTPCVITVRRPKRSGCASHPHRRKAISRRGCLRRTTPPRHTRSISCFCSCRSPRRHRARRRHQCRRQGHHQWTRLRRHRRHRRRRLRYQRRRRRRSRCHRLHCRHRRGRRRSRRRQSAPS